MHLDTAAVETHFLCMQSVTFESVTIMTRFNVIKTSSSRDYGVYLHVSLQNFDVLFEPDTWVKQTKKKHHAF